MNESIKVLLIEDNPGDVRMIQEMLKNTPASLDHVSSMERAQTPIKKGEIDAILLDLSLPDSNGIGSVAKLHAFTTELPIIVLTGCDDMEVINEALGIGVQDYLVKGAFDKELLMRAIYYSIERSRILRRVKTVNQDLYDRNRQLQEQMALREAAEEEAWRLNYAIKQSIDGIAITDSKLFVIFANDAFLEMHGYSPAEAIGMPLEMLHTKEGIIELSAVLESQGYFKSEIEHLKKNGQLFSTYSSINPFHNDKGKKIGYALVCKDISERKFLEAEKQKIEDQLRQSQKLEAIGHLAGGVAHDFNNLLGAILGFADLIKHKFGEANPTLERYVVSIIDTSRRAADLTAQLLAFARKGKYKIAVVDIHEIIQDIIKLLKHTIDRRITIIQKFDASPSTVMGDGTQLQNAILNLAVNARDAMPAGGDLTFASDVVKMDEIYIKTHQYEVTPGTYLKVSVRDTGAGMDKETLKRLFEPFFTTKDVGKGTGLGLASVYGTVKSHNGHIEVISEPGMGATFNIYLPLVKEETIRTSSQIKQDKPHGSGHILLVDDEQVIREVTSEMLSLLGYTVDMCGDGEEAVKYYRERHKEVDLVILDIIMPKMGGYDCFLELTRINPKVKVIIVSGYAINGEAKMIMEKGALGFIQKPFNWGSLAVTIKEAISN